MPASLERTTVTQVMNWGAEATAGSSVVGNKRMTALMVDMGVEQTYDAFRATGFKYDSIVSIGKDSVAGALQGKPTYTEMIYPLSSVAGTAVIATPSGGTASRSWTFSPSSTSNENAQTYTVEIGSSVRAHSFAYGLVTAFSIAFDREKLDLGGALIGQALSDGITITGTPATISLVPILPKQLQVMSNATSGSLGSTVLTRVISGEFSINNKYLPLWVVNSANPAWVAHVDVVPQARFKLKVEADALGMGPLVDARAGTTKFIRLEGVGDVIEAGTITYRMRVDMACKVVGISRFQDSGGVYAIEYDMDVVHDSGWGQAWTAQLVNTLTAL